MKLYAGIDLHSTNSVISVIDEQDRVIYEKRLPNDIKRILLVLAGFKDAFVGVVVESTYNWYFLVDALMGAGYRVHLAHPAANTQYEGLKRTGDEHDARWLAYLLRIGILREGYIYPAGARAVRDLMRRRIQLVQTRTGQLLAMGTQLERSVGRGMKAEVLKAMSAAQLQELVGDRNVASALEANAAVVRSLTREIVRLEREILAQVKLAAQFAPLKSIPGVGTILALAIMLETGDIGRFAKVGHFASYARMVDTRRESNGKKKGQGNTKCGNAYLAWAFIEAAHHASRSHARIKQYFERKARQTKKVVAFKACAHKLARAAYWVMKKQEVFNEEKAFG
jgi:transposase